MLSDHAIHLTCHVLGDVYLAFLVSREHYRDLWVQRKAENLLLVEQLLAAQAK